MFSRIMISFSQHTFCFIYLYSFISEHVTSMQRHDEFNSPEIVIRSFYYDCRDSSILEACENTLV